MRLLMLLLLVVAAPLAGQEPGPPAVAEEPDVLEPEPVKENPMQRTVEVSDETRLAPSIIESDSEAAAAQPTMRNFLYQVLLAAVTALITALVWKAVF